jgi:hypothetical protein
LLLRASLATRRRGEVGGGLLRAQKFVTNLTGGKRVETYNSKGSNLLNVALLCGFIALVNVILSVLHKFDTR